MASSREEQGPSPSSKVFINYYKENATQANRLYLDLKAANLDPWIDKENLLAGQRKREEAEKAIRNSDYFVALFSKISINIRGDTHRQIVAALDVINEIPESKIFLIPARLDNVDISFDKLSEIESVDMFPNWEDGLSKMLKSMKVDEEQIKLAIERQRNSSAYTSSSSVIAIRQQTNIPQTASSLNLTFKGEKQFFVGRQVYINQIIKDKLSVTGSKVSIVGPGGSGKSQLAFKAIREYLSEEIFDLVISVYFGEGLITFEKFLLEIAKAYHHPLLDKINQQISYLKEKD